MKSDERLFDSKSRAAIRAKTDRPYAIAFGVSACVMAGLVGGLHYEELPFLAYWFDYCSPQQFVYDCHYPAALDWMAAGVTGVIAGIALAALFRFRRIRPTVTCHRCGSQGWILDLEQAAGRCPRCGHDRFRYRTLEGTGVPVVRIIDLEDVDAAELLESRRTNGWL